jgi:hypothetical protein
MRTDKVKDCATELQIWANDNDESLTLFEALQIAVSIHRNELFSEAFVLEFSTKPGALESIAMELGASRDGSTIKDAIYSLSK